MALSGAVEERRGPKSLGVRVEMVDIGLEAPDSLAQASQHTFGRGRGAGRC